MPRWGLDQRGEERSGMSATLHSHDTTPTNLVSLPSLGMDAYSALVTRLQAEAPNQATADRIGRGSDLLVHGSIYETAELGVYCVQSACNADVYYTATSFR